MAAAPSLVPLAVVASTAAGDIGLIAIERHDAGWVLLAHRPRGMAEATTASWDAEDATGQAFQAVGGGGHGGDGWTAQLPTFLGQLPDAGQELRSRTTEGSVAVDLTVRLPADTEPAGFTLVVEEARTDEADDDHRARTRRVDEVRSALARAAVPDEVIALQEVLTDLEGGPSGTVTLLGLERWGRLVRLHHHWAPTDARNYSRSPLRSRFDVLDASGRPVAGALAGGGGSTHGGCSYTLDLAVDAVPAELRLRRRYPAV